MKKPVWLMLTLAVLAGACKKNEQNVDPTDDNEAITTATLRLTNKANPADVVTATVENLNTTADFSNATLRLRNNATYSGVVQLYDKTKTPTLDVSAEINNERNEHLFVYTPTASTPLSITITDRDSNPSPGPYPVGLTFDARTSGPSSSTANSLRVQLRHQPNTKNGTATPGTTDLDTSFPVVVQ